MAILLIVISSIIFLILVLVKLHQHHLRYHLPPGPHPWPIIGNLFQIKPVLFECFAEWSHKHGPIMSVWLGSMLNIVVSSSELAMEVLKEKDKQLADRPRGRSVSTFTQDGSDLIWADYGPHYVKVRKVCTAELFSARRLEALRPIREDEVTAMVESIFRECTGPGISEKRIVVKDHLGPVAFNIITRIAFGKRFMNKDGEMDKQGFAFKSIVTDGMKLGWSILEFLPWLQWVFPVDKKAFADHIALRDKLTRVIMDEHAQVRKKHGAKQHFVDALLTMQETYELSDGTITGLLWDMIAAGLDTTAITVEWAMAELIRNPRVQKKAQEELNRVIGSDRIMTESDFCNLPYLYCIVKETLRLHPPTPLMLPHKAASNVKIGGYDVPKGSSLFVNVWAIARDPTIWKCPLEFKPERFMEQDVDMKGSDFRLLPFGAGRRVCPGAQLGINLVQSMLGHLLHHFQWAPREGLKPEEIDMSGSPGLVAYMRTPVQAEPTTRLPAYLYKRVEVDM